MLNVFIFFILCLPYEIIFILLIHFCPNMDTRLSLNTCRKASRVVALCLLFYQYSISTFTVDHICSLIMTYVYCSLVTKNVPLWLSVLLILLSNDIQLNPGPNYRGKYFTFMNWNLNSLPKNDFERVQLIEAHNSLFNYDLISLCETSLNDAIEVPNIILNDYTFISANHPDNKARGA